MKERLPHLLPDKIGTNYLPNLRDYTFARIGLGRKGISIPMKEVLAFKAAHAKARDAIFTPFNTTKLKQCLLKINQECIEVYSSAEDRLVYLQRPDKGRQLNMLSEKSLLNLNEKNTLKDIGIIIADGLSPLAVNEHSIQLIIELVPKLENAGYSVAPIVLLHQGRVAASDEIGELLKVKLVIMLIGERPGLSSPDSMGMYLTYQPKKGLTDERRNCISNIRPRGLAISLAAEKIFYLIQSSLTKRISGVELKDDSNLKIKN